MYTDQVKQTLPDHVVYTLSVSQASSQDSGVYECSVTNTVNGEVRVNSVAINVFGELWREILIFNIFILISATKNCYNLELMLFEYFHIIQVI